MIDLKDFIVHETLRKNPRYKGEVNKEKRFACYCEKCGNMRGYIKKSHYKKKSKLCRDCIFSSVEYINQQRENAIKQHKLNPPKRCPDKAFNNRLRNTLRNRLNRAIKGNYKAGSAVSDLGCSIEELKKHLESKFQPGMTWENWTRDGWHIDHIKSLASFDLSNKDEFLEAVNYKNLQPMWAEDNLKKGS